MINYELHIIELKTTVFDSLLLFFVIWFCIWYSVLINWFIVTWKRCIWRWNTRDTCLMYMITCAAVKLWRNRISYLWQIDIPTIRINHTSPSTMVPDLRRWHAQHRRGCHLTSFRSTAHELRDYGTGFHICLLPSTGFRPRDFQPIKRFQSSQGQWKVWALGE